MVVVEVVELVEVVEVVELVTGFSAKVGDSAKLGIERPTSKPRVRNPAVNGLLRRNKVNHPPNVEAIEARTPITKGHLNHSTSLTATFAQGVVEAIGLFFGFGLE